jgi:cell division septum initiation protein DivIVA
MTRLELVEKEIKELKEKVATLEKAKEKPKPKSTVQTQIGEV